MRIKENKHIQESIITNTLPNGLKCYIIPKKNYCEKMAVAAVNYGARDIYYKKDGAKYESPKGTAHFLEHKLFDEQWGNVFDIFSQLGGQANAFTNYDMTAYYFNCSENFEKNMELLTQFVQSPYFTKESVEKEQGIIAQEIVMYNDHPIWRCFLNMLSVMYHNDTVRHSIAGTVESINEITHNTLHDCYKGFYTPDNMAFIVCGGVDCDKTLYNLQKQFTITTPTVIERVYLEEPTTIASTFISDKMAIATPIFHFGFKLNNKNKSTAQETAASRVILDLLFGQTSKFYTSLFGESLLSNSFGYECSRGNGYGYITLAGETTDYEAVQQKLFDEIQRVKREGVCKTAFERIKRNYTGRFLKGFNSVSTITFGQIESIFLDYDLFDLYENIIALDLDLLNQKVHDYFNEEQFVCSVILPE